METVTAANVRRQCDGCDLFRQKARQAVMNGVQNKAGRIANQAW
jgi:hypothetical protein